MPYDILPCTYNILHKPPTYIGPTNTSECTVPYKTKYFFKREQACLLLLTYNLNLWLSPYLACFKAHADLVICTYLK